MAVLVIVLAASFVAVFGKSDTAVAATSSTINFQARLLTAAGAVVPDGQYNVEFKLYTASTGGSAAWTETRTSTDKVRVVNGYLTVNLGSVNPFSGINWDQELWLTMNIGGTGSPSWDGEMTPRLKLTAVPYAFTAGKLVGGTGANTTILDTGTPSGNNVIHLPAENGTLCIQNSANCGFALSSGGTNYIQNQFSAAQTTANFWISGVGRMDTALQSPAIRPTTNGTTAIQFQNAAGSSTALSIDTTNSRVSIGNGGTAFAPAEALDVIGNIQVRDAATATKGYRLRTSGTALDFEASGADLYLSNWSGASYTGTQRNYLRLESGANIAHAVGSWQFAPSPAGTTRHTIDGTTGTSVTFNQDGEATNFTIQGDTDASLFFVQGSTDRVGIGTNTPGYKLDVNGDINVSTGSVYRINGQPICSVAGCVSAPSSGSYIQNQNATQQTSADFWISGNGRADTALQTPLVDTATAVALNIGTTNATVINLNKDTTLAAGKSLNIGSASALGALTVQPGTAATIGAVIKAAASQTADLLQFRDNSNNVNASFNSTGNQISLGRIAGSGTVTQGKIILSDGTTSNFGATLQTNGTLAGNSTFRLGVGSANGTYDLCTTLSVCSGYAATSGSGNYIQNQNAAQQTAANFWISGNGRADTSLQTPLLDTATAVALNVGTTNATAINLNKDTTLAVGKTLSLSAAATSTNLLFSQVTGDTNPRFTIAADGTLKWGPGNTATDTTLSRTASGALTVNNDFIASSSLQVGTPGVLGAFTVQPGAAGTIGAVIKGAASQTADLLQFRDSSNNINASVNAAGNQLTLGRVAGSGTVTQGKLLFSDGTTSNFGATLQTTGTLAGSSTFRINVGSANGAYDICTTLSVCTGYAPATGGTGYIQNSTSIQTSANFYIQSAAATSVGGIIRGAASQTSSLLQLLDGTSGLTVAQFTNNGYLSLGSDSISRGGQITFNDTTTSNGFTGTINTPAAFTASQTYTLPDESGTICIQSSANCGFATSTGGTGYIQNQFAAAQSSSNFWISGTGRAVTLQAGTLDAAAAGVLNIGTSVATSLQVGSNTNNTALTFDSGTGAINMGTGAQARTINIGTGGATQTVTIGSQNSASSLTLDSGTGAINIGSGAQARSINIGNGGANQTITIGSTSGTSSLTLNSGTGTIGIGTTAQARSVNVGTGGAAQTVTVGSQNTTSSLTLDAGSGTIAIGTSGSARTVNIATGGALQTVTLGSQNGASTLALDSGTGAINIGSGAQARSVNVGNGGANQTVTVGSTSGTSSLTLNAGTGTIGIGTSASIRTVNIATGAAAQTVTLGSQSGASSLALDSGTGAINIGAGAQARSVNVGTGGAAQTVTVGSQNTTSSLTLDSGTGNINIGTSAAARTTNIATGAAVQAVTVGSQNGASSLTLQSGTGNVTLLTNSASAKIIAKSSTNTTTAFQVQNSSSAAVLNVDTTNSRVGIGSSADTPTRTLDVTTNDTNSTQPAIRLQQSGTGDATIELGTASENYYVGVDSTDGKFKVSSAAASSGTINAGETSSTGTTDSGNDAYVIGSQFTTPASAGTLNSVSMYIINAAGNLKMGIYADNGSDAPGTLLATTAEITPTTGWNTIPISGAITASTKYWIMYRSTSSALSFPDTASGKSAWKTVSYASAWPTPYGTPTATSSALHWALYMTYTPSGTVDSFNSNLLSIGDTGQTAFKNTVNTTTAFQVQNASGTSILSVDTTNARVVLGTASSSTGKLLFNNASNANTVALQSGVTTSGYTLTLPTALGVTGDCLKDGGSGALQFTACGNQSGTLQAAYTSGLNGTTPEIIVDATRGGVDIQDVSTPGTSFGTSPLLAVRGQATASTLGSKYFSVQGDGKVAIGNITATEALDVVGNINISSGSSYKINGTSICTSSGCTPAAGSGNYIQNQSAGQQSSSTFWISGTGRSDNALQAPILDAPTAVALNIGTTNATAINLNQNVTLASGKSLTLQGTYAQQPAADGTSIFNIKTSTGNNLFTVDSTNTRIGIGLGSTTLPAYSGSAGIEIKGGFRLSGASQTYADNYTTPLGTSIKSLINIVNYDPGAFNQLIALGLPSSANSNARIISLLDARATTHQPSLGVLSPNENEIGGFSWDGSNTDFKVKNSPAAGTISLNVNGANQLTVSTSAISLLQNTTVASGKTLTVTSGATSLTGATTGDALTVSNSTSTGNVAVFNDNASSVFTIGDGGVITATTTASTSSAFVIQNGSSQALFSTDTFNNSVHLRTIGRNNTSTYEAIWLQGSKNGITSLIGGNDDTSAYAANDFSGSLRFNGSGVAWGDFAYFPQGGGNGNNGQFRFSTTGSALGTAPNAKVGVGDLYVNGNAGIGTNSPGYKVDVAGDVNISTGSAYKINGTNICTSSGCTPAAGSANYIQNQNSIQQTSSNFWVSGTGRVDGGVLTNNVTSNSGALILQAATNVVSLGGSDTFTANGGFTILSGANSNLTVNATGTGALSLGNNAVNGRVINIGSTAAQANTTTINIGTSTAAAQTISIGSTNGSGTTTISGGTGGVNLITNSASAIIVAKSSTNSTSAFQVQNSGGTAAINVDTTNSRLGVGTTTPNEKIQVVGGGINISNTTNNNAGSIRWSGSDFEGYNGTSWVSMTSNVLTTTPVVSKRKAANETVNNSSTFQADDELFFNIGANETWSFRFTIHATSGTTPDLKFNVSAPAGATCVNGIADIEGAVAVGNLGCGVSTGVIAGTGNDDVFVLYGTVANGATAGAMTLNWAQNTTTASNTTVYAGSAIDATRSVGNSGVAQAFIQGGNSFGAAAVLGTNDAQALNVQTNGATRLSISSIGNTTLTGGTSGVALTVNNSTSTGNIANFQSNGTNALTLNNNGDLVIDGIADSATAFQIIDGSAQALFVYNTSTGALAMKGTGTNFGGSRIYFGDQQWAYIGEYSTGDTDQLALYGNDGIYFGTTSATDVMTLIGTALTVNGDSYVTGQMGVGTTNPSEVLTVNGNFNVRNSDTPTKAYRFRTNGGSLDFEAGGANMYLSVWSDAAFSATQRTYIIMYSASSRIDVLSTYTYFNPTTTSGDVIDVNRTGNGTLVGFAVNGGLQGSISISGTTVSYNAFTGSHYALADEDIGRGFLVSMTGNNQRKDPNDSSAEPFYGVEKTAMANDPKVLGSFLGIIDPSKALSMDNPYQVMSVGNGDMWVDDEGGDVQPGDYLISSNLAGYAMKDNGQFAESNIVARASDGINWSNETAVINGHKVRKISVLFTQFTKLNATALAMGLTNGSIVSNDVTFNGLVMFSKAVTFQDDVSFMGHIKVGDNTAGTVKIPAGQTSVSVAFSNAYAEIPKITTGVSDFTTVKVDAKTKNGFVLRLPSAQSDDVYVDWTALETQ